MSNFMKIRPVGAELFHSIRTDRHDKANFANVRDNAVRSLAWLWKQGIPPKHWYLPNKFLEVTSHKTEGIKTDGYCLLLQGTYPQARCGGQIRPCYCGWE